MVKTVLQSQIWVILLSSDTTIYSKSIHICNKFNFNWGKTERTQQHTSEPQSGCGTVEGWTRRKEGKVLGEAGRGQRGKRDGQEKINIVPPTSLNLAVLHCSAVVL